MSMGILDELQKTTKLSEANLKLQKASSDRQVAQNQISNAQQAAQTAALQAQTAMIQAEQMRKEKQRQMKNIVFEMKQSVERLVTGNYNGIVSYIAGTLLNQKFDSFGFGSRDLEDLQDKEYYSKTKTILLEKLDSISAEERQAGIQYINEMTQSEKMIARLQNIFDVSKKFVVIEKFEKNGSMVIRKPNPLWIALDVLSFLSIVFVIGLVLLPLSIYFGWKLSNQNGVKILNSELKEIVPETVELKTIKEINSESAKLLSAKRSDLENFLNKNHPEVRLLASI